MSKASPTGNTERIEFQFRGTFQARNRFGGNMTVGVGAIMKRASDSCCSGVGLPLRSITEREEERRQKIFIAEQRAANAI